MKNKHKAFRNINILLKNSDKLLPLYNNKHHKSIINKKNIIVDNNTGSSLDCLIDLVKYIYNSDSNGHKYWKSTLIIEYTSGTIRITYFISLLELIKKIVDDLGWILNISIELSG